MAKKRVYDLAKEYGMKGQELLQKLHDLGFTADEVKSHMSVVDDMLELQVRARLEANGILPESVKADSEEKVFDDGGLKIRRKKKRAVSEAPASDQEVATTEVAPPIETTAMETAATEATATAEAEGTLQEPPPTEVPVAGAPAAELPVAEIPAAEVPIAEPPVAETPVAGIPVAGIPIAGIPIAGIPALGAADAEAAPVELDTQPEAGDPTLAAEAPTDGDLPSEAPVEAEAKEDVVVAPEQAPAPEEVRPAAAAAELPSPAPEPASPEPAAEAEVEVVPAAASASPGAEVKAEVEAVPETPQIVRPSEKRRAGKVVGFVDLSKIQPSTQRARPDSRRLRSADEDVAPDVQPTLARNRKQAFVRGDHGPRGQLTAQQLRERESARYLRRRGPGGADRGRGRGSDRGGSRSAAGGSPFTGQTVVIDDPITVKKLAETLSVKVNDMVRKSIQQGLYLTITQTMDHDTAALLAGEFGVELDIHTTIEAEEALLREFEEQRQSVEDEDLVDRPPCVAFLGHVDHGKTTLIDTIRKSRITHHESGGITQHIGAYQVSTKSGNMVTIIDTPGHAAFSAMRARGADAVDVIVLVVAADDGVMPQTEEAIQHARAAKKPIVVAMNKMDKPAANPDKVKNELAAQEITPEEWGGDVAIMPVSALKGEGIEELLERVFLESEVLELKSHPEGAASGVVLEAEIQQGKGKVAHLLVQDGSLQRGDVILAGVGYGKVRSIHDDRGKQIKSAGPSLPVEVTGLNELPDVGDEFHVVDNLDRAKEVAEERSRKERQVTLAERKAVSRENLFEAVAESKKQQLNYILKCDVRGSVQPLLEQIRGLDHEEVGVTVVAHGVGQVSESDVDLAITSGSTILAFRVGTNGKARQHAEHSGIEIRSYQVIYEVIDAIKKEMEGSLAPEFVEEVTGLVEIRRIFRSSRLGNIAGCFVLEGTIARDSRVRLLRDGKVLHTGPLASLKREKDDTKEVRADFECGIVLRDYNDIREGDKLEPFRLKEVKRLLEIES